MPRDAHAPPHRRPQPSEQHLEIQRPEPEWGLGFLSGGGGPAGKDRDVSTCRPPARLPLSSRSAKCPQVRPWDPLHLRSYLLRIYNCLRRKTWSK